MAHIIITGRAYMDLSFAVYFFVIFLLFNYQTTRKKRYAPFFIISLLCGFFGGLFSFFDQIFPSTSVNLLRLIAATIFSLQFIFFFLFMENMRSLKLSSLRLSFIIILYIIQVGASVGQAILLKFPGNDNIQLILLFLMGFTYNLLGFYVYFIIGVPLYYKTHRYATDTRSLIMLIALVLVGVGFLLAAFYELFVFLGIYKDFGEFNPLRLLYYTLPLIGLFLFLLCYITDIDYLYRLPIENYALTVSYKSGITIHTVHFKTRYEKIEIDKELLNGSIRNTNLLFNNILSSKSEIKNISSEDVAILMHSGRFITTKILANSVSVILDRSLQRYVEEFEKKFHKQLEAEDKLVSDFDSAIDLLKQIFPYLTPLK